MNQILVGGYADPLNKNGDEFNAISGGFTWNGSEANRLAVLPCAGTIKNLRVELDGAPGNLDTEYYDFDVSIEGADTAVDCRIKNAETSGNSGADSVVVAAGETISLHCTPSAGPTPDNTPNARWTVEFVGDNANESIILGVGKGENAGTRYIPIAHSNTVSATAGAHCKQVIPTDGKLQDFYLEFDRDPGATGVDGFTFTLYENDIASSSDEDGDPLAVTIMADDTTGNENGETIDVAPGSFVYLRTDIVDTPVDLAAGWGFVFLADTDGESVLLGGTTNDTHNANVEVNQVVEGNYTMSWVAEASESDRWQLAQEGSGGAAAVLKNLHVLVDRDPDNGGGAGDYYNFGVRVAGVLSAVVAQVAGGGTTGDSGANTVTLSDDDEVSIECDPDGTLPLTETWTAWGVVCFISVGGAAHTKTLGDTVAIADSIVKAVGQPQADSVAIADAVANAVGRVQADTIAIADAVAKASGVGLADTITIADSIVKDIGQIQADTIAITDAISKGVGIPQADTIAIVDAIANTVGKPLADTMTIADTLSKAVGISLSDTILIVDSIVAGVTIYLSLYDTIAISDSLYMQWGLPKRMAAARLAAARLTAARLSASRLAKRRMSP